jgi:hypothetical protein
MRVRFRACCRAHEIDRPRGKHACDLISQIFAPVRSSTTPSAGCKSGAYCRRDRLRSCCAAPAGSHSATPSPRPPYSGTRRTRHRRREHRMDQPPHRAIPGMLSKKKSHPIPGDLHEHREIQLETVFPVDLEAERIDVERLAPGIVGDPQCGDNWLHEFLQPRRSGSCLVDGRQNFTPEFPSPRCHARR